MLYLHEMRYAREDGGMSELEVSMRRWHVSRMERCAKMSQIDDRRERWRHMMSQAEWEMPGWWWLPKMKRRGKIVGCPKMRIDDLNWCDRNSVWCHDEVICTDRSCWELGNTRIMEWDEPWWCDMLGWIMLWAREYMDGMVPCHEDEEVSLDGWCWALGNTRMRQGEHVSREGCSDV